MPHDVYTPLGLADDALLRPSAWERSWMLLPIVGWCIAGILSVDRVQLARIEVRRQLDLRHQFPSDAWLASGLSTHEAEAVCKLIAISFGMPNHFFLPADPNGLIFLDQDGIGPLEVVSNVRNELGVDLRGRSGLYAGVLADFVSKISPSEVAA